MKTAGDRERLMILRLGATFTLLSRGFLYRRLLQLLLVFNMLWFLHTIGSKCKLCKLQPGSVNKHDTSPLHLFIITPSTSVSPSNPEAPRSDSSSPPVTAKASRWKVSDRLFIINLGLTSIMRNPMNVSRYQQLYLSLQVHAIERSYITKVTSATK